MANKNKHLVSILTLLQRRKWPLLAIGVMVVVLSAIAAISMYNSKQPNYPHEDEAVSEPGTKPPTSTELSSDSETTEPPSSSSKPKKSTGTGGASDGTTTVPTSPPVVPASTRELRAGQPLEYFPFPIMTESPHSVHDPVTGFASVSNNNGSYVFTVPEATNDLGLYGIFWLSPTPPTPNALLTGVRFTSNSWTGTVDNSVIVYSLLDRNTENNALGSVTGAYQGLANELVAVMFDTTPSTDVIELKLYTPVANSGERFVLAIDTENLPTGQPTIFPSTISTGTIEWLWSS